MGERKRAFSEFSLSSLSTFSLYPPITLFPSPDLPIPATFPTDDGTSTELSTPAFPPDQPIASNLVGNARNNARRCATQLLSHHFLAKPLRCRSSPAQPSFVESSAASICSNRPTIQLQQSQVRSSTGATSCATITPRLSCQPPGVASMSSR